MNFDPYRGLTREGPDTAEEVRIIAVEFTMVHQPSGVSQELEMFSCQHTIGRHRNGAGGYEAVFTLHTSAGDRQVRGWVQF